MKSNTTTASIVFHTLHRSGGMNEGKVRLFEENGSWPLDYCRRHKHYAQGNIPIRTETYCAWIDPVLGPKLRAEEILDKERQRASKANKVKRSALDIILGHEPTVLETILGK